MNDDLKIRKMYIGSDVTEYVCGKDAIDSMNGGGIFLVSGILRDKFPGKMKRLEGENVIYMDDGEAVKDIKNYENVCRKLVENDVERNSLITYVGGGTLGDLTGFIASTYKRGLRLRAMPTTLLSMVDSSIGGKNGINFSGLKNAIGTFKNPEVIVADTDFIVGNENILREGLAEIIKHGLSLDYSIIETLGKNNIETISKGNTLRDLIVKNAGIKGDICNSDPFELTEKRYVLNFGHTVAHGIEAASGNRISHGMAVIYGMIFEIKMAREYGTLGHDPSTVIGELLEKYHIQLPEVNEKMLRSSLRYMVNDKKVRDGMINIPMISNPGESVIVNMELGKMRELFLKVMGMMSR